MNDNNINFIVIFTEIDNESYLIWLDDNGNDIYKILINNSDIQHLTSNIDFHLKSIKEFREKFKNMEFYNFRVTTVCSLEGYDLVFNTSFDFITNSFTTFVNYTNHFIACTYSGILETEEK